MLFVGVDLKTFAICYLLQLRYGEIRGIVEPMIVMLSQVEPTAQTSGKHVLAL